MVKRYIQGLKAGLHDVRGCLTGRGEGFKVGCS